MNVWAEDWKQDISNEVSKLFLESYFDISMCVLLAFLSYVERDRQGKIEFLSFFETPNDIWCTILCLIHMFLIIIFPWVGYYRINSNFDRLSKDKNARKSFQEKYPTLLDESRFNTKP